MAIVISGQSGSVDWTYLEAAQVGAWSVTAGTLDATLVASHPVRLRQQPLTFVVRRPQRRAWRWPIVSLSIAGQHLTARLGPQES